MEGAITAPRRKLEIREDLSEEIILELCLKRATGIYHTDWSCTAVSEKLSLGQKHRKCPRITARNVGGYSLSRGKLGEM